MCITRDMGNEHLHPSLYQSIDQTSPDPCARESDVASSARQAFTPYSARSTVLSTQQKISYTRLFPGFAASPSVHLASSETLLVRMPSQIHLQTVKIGKAASSQNPHFSIQGHARQKWSGISAVGVQTVSAASRKRALPLPFSRWQAPPDKSQSYRRMTVDRQKSSL